MTETEARESLRDSGIPSHLHDGLIRYVVSGIRPGSSLTSCIVLNVEEAVLRAADAFTKISIPNITTWLLTEAPAECVGTRDLMEAWIKKRSKERQEAVNHTNREE